jgi:hypothetical protein
MQLRSLDDARPWAKIKVFRGRFATAARQSSRMSQATETLAAHALNLRQRLLQEGNLLLEIKAVPRSRSAGVAQLMANGLLKVRVTSAPEKGRANEEICAILAAYLAVPARNVSLVNGFTSAQKRVRITV